MQKPIKVDEISQDINQRTCELSLSGEGLRRFRGFLAATFLTVVLCLVGTRGAAGPEDALLLEADFGEIGWLCIKTFFKGGEPLPKRTTGAAGKYVKGEPSACLGVGPFCCCKETEQNYKNHCKPLQKICNHFKETRVIVPVLRGRHIQHRVASVPSLCFDRQEFRSGVEH